MNSLPILISALCITLYWVTVGVKSVKLARKIGKDPNVLPRERTGQLARIIWAPTIILWILFLWRGVMNPGGIALPSFLSYSAAFIVIVATILTFWCWHQMGRSWRIGIDPNEKTQLIVSGPYQYVLHPIYSLSILLGLTTLMTLPTLAMLITVSIHIFMLNAEARREETYLITTHGQSYREYQQNRGRFFPKLSLKSRVD